MCKNWKHIREVGCSAAMADLIGSAGQGSGTAESEESGVHCCSLRGGGPHARQAAAGGHGGPARPEAGCAVVIPQSTFASATSLLTS